jgi:hypothetical protein
MNFYFSPNIIRVIKSRGALWAGNVALMGKMKNINKILVGNSKGNRPCWGHRLRQEDNIK